MKCFECPCSTTERRILGRYHRCSITGEFVKMGGECTLPVSTLRYMTAKFSEVLKSRVKEDSGDCRCW